MSWCEMCKHNERYRHESPCDICEFAYDNTPTQYEPKPQTNADRFRSMTDEEIAEWNADFYCPPSRWENGGECPRRQERNENKCYECWLDWLKQEVNNESN